MRPAKLSFTSCGKGLALSMAVYEKSVRDLVLALFLSLRGSLSNYRYKG